MQSEPSEATATKPCCDQMYGDMFIDGRYVEATCPVHGRQPNYGVALNATRTDSPTDAANARRINLMAAWFADNYSEDREWEDMLHEASAALPPSHSGEVERRALQEAVTMWNDLRYPFTEQAPKIYDVLCAALRNSSDGETK